MALGAGACGEDRGNVDVEGSTTGGSKTGTTAATVDRSKTDPKQLAAAMSKVKAYAVEQTGALVTSTQKLQQAIDSGDVDAAKKAYEKARPYYERIEPLVVLFPELDGKIDAREDDFPKKAEDPNWTGFHPIERDLWKDEKITAATEKLAAGLYEDSTRLNDLMVKAVVKPEVVIPGTAELIDEVEESKITGEEERYSKLDLPTFVANLDGAKAFYETLSPLVKAKDPSLDKQIQEAFDDAYAEVNKLKKGGDFVSYDELTDAQQKEVKQTIEALAEPLARVQGVLGVDK
ncbi:MAG TPA: EfeM/EfeO family lipoprotein [Thermoleophilaceae bacterium]|nr:EfeM/EfeO family lipoprotein [Thermoleophilaceae bacterium]